jgi:hypothetical protein
MQEESDLPNSRWSARRDKRRLQEFAVVPELDMPTQAELIGSWNYFPGKSYEIIRSGGKLLFKESTPDGLVQGKLLVDGEWLVAQATTSTGSPYGMVRLRYEDGYVISNFRTPRGEGWGSETKAFSRRLIKPSGHYPASEPVSQGRPSVQFRVESDVVCGRAPGAHAESIEAPDALEKPVLTVDGCSLRVSWTIPSMSPAVSKIAVALRTKGGPWQYAGKRHGRNVLLPVSSKVLDKDAYAAPTSYILVSGLREGQQYEATVSMYNTTWGAWSPPSDSTTLEFYGQTAEPEPEEAMQPRFADVDHLEEVLEFAAPPSKPESVPSTIQVTDAEAEACETSTIEEAPLPKKSSLHHLIFQDVNLALEMHDAKFSAKIMRTIEDMMNSREEVLMNRIMIEVELKISATCENILSEIKADAVADTDVCEVGTQHSARPERQSSEQPPTARSRVSHGSARSNRFMDRLQVEQLQAEVAAIRRQWEDFRFFNPCAERNPCAEEEPDVPRLPDACDNCDILRHGAFERYRQAAGSPEKKIELSEKRARIDEWEDACLGMEEEVIESGAADNRMVNFKKLRKEHMRSPAMTKNLGDAQKQSKHVLVKGKSVALEEIAMAHVMHTMGQEGHVRHLQESIWEAGAVFIGMPQMGLPRSLVLTFALIANAMWQVSFCIIILIGFDENKVDKDDASLWRTFIGHNSHHIDDGGVSLASRVCNQSPTLSMAFEQASLVEDAEKYGTSLLLGFQAGGMLCFMCITIWFLHVVSEAKHAVGLWIALWTIQKADHTHLVLSNDGKWFLATTSPRRRLFFSIVTVVRLCVALFLLIQGSSWLMITSNLEVMMLNAVALAFILEIDEIIYKCFAPRHCKTIHHRIEPFPLPRVGHATGLAGALTMIFFLAYGVMMFLFIESPNMDEYITAVCSQNLDFAYFYHEELSVIFSVQTAPYQGPGQTNSGDLVRAAVDEMKNGIVEVGLLQHSKVIEDIARLQSYRTMSASSLADAELTDCIDTFPDQFPSYWRRVRHQVGRDVSLCSELIDECGHPSYSLVRMLCPYSCRCYFSKPSTAVQSGCPPLRCQDNTVVSAYYDEDASCSDYTAAVLQYDTNWIKYWRSIQAYLEQSTPQHTKTFLQQENESPAAVANTAIQEGCAFIAQSTSRQQWLCADNSIFISLGSYCPEACQCKDNDYWGCSSNCQEDDSGARPPPRRP